MTTSENNVVVIRHQDHDQGAAAIEAAKRSGVALMRAEKGRAAALWELAAHLHAVYQGDYIRKVLGVSKAEWVRSNFLTDEGLPASVEWTDRLVQMYGVVHEYPIVAQAGRAPGSHVLHLTNASFACRLARVQGWCRADEPWSMTEESQRKIIKLAMDKTSKQLANDYHAVAKLANDAPSEPSETPEMNDEKLPQPEKWDYWGGRVSRSVLHEFNESTDWLLKRMGRGASNPTVVLETVAVFIADVREALGDASKGDTNKLRSLMTTLESAS
jgi:hypothetical protein